jgi:hypothetical protein
MEKRELVKNLLPVLIAVAALIVLANMSATSPVTNSGEGISYHAYVCVYKNSQLIECGHNLFTNLGKNMTRDLLGQGIGAKITYVGLANYTGSGMQASDTSLTGEWGTCGLGRQEGTYSTTGTSPGNWTIEKTFTSTCNNAIVNATGLFNSSTGSTLFAEDTFTSTTLQNGDSITVRWYIWVT